MKQPPRSRLAQFVLFGINGGVVALVYSAAVWTLIALSPKTFPLDVMVAYAVSVFANYMGARLIFKPATQPRSHVPRYLSVVAGNFVLTAGLAWLFHRLGAPTIVSAYAPVVITAVPTFLVMRSWVFKHPKRSADSKLKESDVEVPRV